MGRGYASNINTGFIYECRCAKIVRHSALDKLAEAMAQAGITLAAIVPAGG
jgi:hypothetical protein